MLNPDAPKPISPRTAFTCPLCKAAGATIVLVLPRLVTFACARCTHRWTAEGPPPSKH